MTSKPALIILIPLILSAFTHLWNPIGFPDFFSDEGVYLRRALHVMEGLGPQETETYYDHPFFGQFVLAGILHAVQYPDAYSSQSEGQSVEKLFAVPRILMGLFAIIDTFLIFKISEKQYNRKVALIASILFAVMPMTWFTRRILLESIQLPFLLSSKDFTSSDNLIISGLFPAIVTTLCFNIIVRLSLYIRITETFYRQFFSTRLINSSLFRTHMVAIDYP